MERPAGGSQHPGHAAALGGADGQPSEDQLAELGRQRDGRQFAARRQQLLGDERPPARSLDDDDEDAGRWSLALDRLDQAREIVMAERTERQSSGRPDRRLERAQVDRPRVVATDRVALIRPDDGQPLVVRDPREEGDERPGPGVGTMEVLDRQQDRLSRREPADDAEDAFEESRLAALGHRPRPPSRRRRPMLVVTAPGARGVGCTIDPGSDVGQQPTDLVRRRPEDLAQVVIGQRGERRAERPDDGAVRAIGATSMRAAAQHEHRLLEGADATDGLIDEARGAGAGRAIDEQRAGIPGRCRSKHGRKRTECVLSPYEPRAREPDGHAAF